MRLQVSVRKRWARLALFAGLTLWLSTTSCRQAEQDVVLAPTYGAEFAPLSVGAFWEYQFDTLERNILPVLREEAGTVFQRWTLQDTLEHTPYYTSFRLLVEQRSDTLQAYQPRRLDVMIKRFDGALVLQSDVGNAQLLQMPFTKGTGWNFRAFSVGGGATPYQIRFRGLSTGNIAQFSGSRDSTCLSSHLETVAFRQNIGLQSRYSYKATFVEDPLNPCAQPVQYQTRQIKRWTLLRSGRR